MKRIQRLRLPAAALLVCMAATVAGHAQTFDTLVRFNGKNGKNPGAPPVQGLNGNFYGTTSAGGAGNCATRNVICGTLFEITPEGKLTTVHSFCSQPHCPDGGEPYAGLVQIASGDLYGTTYAGGSGYGTIFEITPAGELTTLYSFCSQHECSDGVEPTAAMVQAIDGNFYGTTIRGGANCVSALGCGTVFEITPAGKLTSLYSFCSQPQCADGSSPSTGLVQATNENLYGTTSLGGNVCEFDSQGCGTVFKITPGGVLTTLYTFCSQTKCGDGGYPLGQLLQATDGNLYGTTGYGGAIGGGTIFKISLAGELTTLYSFCSQPNCTDGYHPYAGLVQATDGNFYGTTNAGGGNGLGTIFEITPEGKLTTLYSFCSEDYPKCTDGSNVGAGLVQATDGNFYGTTYEGGTGDGTLFSISVGLGPFVETLPTVGKVGTHVVILGTNLTGTTSVTFNGTNAAFIVLSDTQIDATVPTGATTGKVQVMTPSGTLTSNVVFRVRPWILNSRTYEYQ